LYPGGHEFKSSDDHINFIFHIKICLLRTYQNRNRIEDNKNRNRTEYTTLLTIILSSCLVHSHVHQDNLTIFENDAKLDFPKY
jgi:transcription initiation factor TFIIIB Brf1 subunit/transcription initiation factor TFIIB